MRRFLATGVQFVEVHCNFGYLVTVQSLHREVKGRDAVRHLFWSTGNDALSKTPGDLKGGSRREDLYGSNSTRYPGFPPMTILSRSFCDNPKGRDPDLAGRGPDHFGQDDEEGDVEDEGRSVLHQIDEDGNLREDPMEGNEESEAAPSGEEELEDDAAKGDKTDAELRALEGEEKYNAMFNQWYRSPTKNRHLLNEIISPRILDDLERWTVDRGSDINPSDFHQQLVDIRASQKVVKSGRIIRYRAMVVVGDLKGLCGYSSSKAATVQAAIENAKKRALKDLIFIPRYREHTIFEPSSAKCTATKVLMWPRSRGFGLHCNDLLFQVCELVGIQDISIKVIGSRSKFNTIHAFFEALEKTKSSLEVAREKGVYLRERCLFKPPASMEGWV